ncbi:MAG: hypothetical protein ACRD2G_16720 [Terriglobia bacterium]
MTRLIDRRTRLAFETPFLISKRPLIVAVEPWGLRLREKASRARSLPITWGQVWNRAAIIAAEQKRAERQKPDPRKGRSVSREKIR